MWIYLSIYLSLTTTRYHRYCHIHVYCIATGTNLDLDARFHSIQKSNTYATASLIRGAEMTSFIPQCQNQMSIYIYVTWMPYHPYRHNIMSNVTVVHFVHCDKETQPSRFTSVHYNVCIIQRNMWWHWNPCHRWSIYLGMYYVSKSIGVYSVVLIKVKNDNAIEFTAALNTNSHRMIHDSSCWGSNQKIGAVST